MPAFHNIASRLLARAASWASSQPRQVIRGGPYPVGDIGGNGRHAVLDFVVAVRANEQASIKLLPQRLKAPRMSTGDVETL